MKTILFDLDGTLVDTLVDISDALDTVLIDSGFMPVGLARCRQLVGDGARSLVARALGEANAAACDTVLESFREYYGAHVAVASALYPGVADLLDALAKRNLTLAVISNKPEPLTCALVDSLFRTGTFALVRGARDGVGLKPSPQAVVEVLAELGAEAEQTVMVGDGTTDVLAAQAAGILSAGVSWGYRSGVELRAAGAAAILDKPANLLALLDSWGHARG